VERYSQRFTVTWHLLIKLGICSGLASLIPGYLLVMRPWFSQISVGLYAVSCNCTSSCVDCGSDSDLHCTLSAYTRVNNFCHNFCCGKRRSTYMRVYIYATTGAITVLVFSVVLILILTKIVDFRSGLLRFSWSYLSNVHILLTHTCSNLTQLSYSHTSSKLLICFGKITVHTCKGQHDVLHFIQNN